MDVLEMLQAGDVEAFNEAKERGAKVELFAEELAGLKLHAVDLSGLNLDKSDLTESDLTEATLVRSFMSDIDGTGLVLDGVLAMKVKMRDAWLEKADLTGGDFSRGDLTGAVLTASKGEGVRMIGTRLKDAKADGASWPLADLTEATLSGADFTGADLSKAKLTEAKAGGSVFKDAQLDGADAAQVNFGGADLSGANLRGARLVGASFAGAKLLGADLSHADLSRANLTGADLTGADLTGASLADAVLDQAVLVDVTWTDADLTGLDAALLGLADDAVAVLAAHGARFDPEAPLVFDDAVVAVAAGVVAAAWMNPDDAETLTFRYALLRADGTRHMGVMPLSGSSVMAHAVLPLGEGFALVAIVDRPSGATVTRWKLSVDGVVSAPVSAILGYEPAVLPVFRATDDALFMWCLSRRGPVLVVHRDKGDDEGFQVVHNESRAQASGFFGFGWPVLATKGGVVMAVGATEIGPPRRTPEGFPTRISTAVPCGERVLAVWTARPKVRDPGGLRYQWLGGRRAEDTEVLTREPDVNGLDAIPLSDERVLIAWTEEEGPEGGHVMITELPDGEPREVPFPETHVDGMRIVPPYRGKGPWLAVTTLTGELHVVGLNGKAAAVFPEDA